jgi:hypothetical protein
VLLRYSALAFAPRQQGLVLAVGCSSTPAAAAAAAQLGGSLCSSSSVLLFEAAGVLRQQLPWMQLGKIQVGCMPHSCDSYRHSNLVDRRVAGVLKQCTAVSFDEP